MTLKILGTGLLAATMIAAAPGLASAETATRSTECADKTGSVASLTRDDWAAWTKDQKDQAAKPASTESAKEAGKPTTKELAEQYQELLRQEKAEETGEQRQQSASRDTPATTGSAAPADRATDAADDPEAEANTPKANADGSEHYSAPSGGYSSGAHIGNESPTDSGNSAGGMEESKSAERMTQKDC